jgi:translation initiation factor IF-3
MDRFRVSGLLQQQHVSIACQPVNVLSCTRQFSSNSKEEKLLINERLVATIMKNSRETTPEDVKVRMLLDTKEGSTNEIVSLKKAIQTAVQADKDLVEVALTQEVPVVKVIHVEKAKQMKEKKQKALPVKEVQMTTDIADNDLQRKTNQMISYLKKGHITRIRIRAKRYRVKENVNVLDEMVTKVVQIAENEKAGELVKSQMNEQRTQVLLVLQTPAKNKAKQ